MDINSKTIQTNTFSEGMNTDVSDALLKDSQYRLAHNVRYITNTDSNTGELHSIEGNIRALSAPLLGDIIATTSIRQYGVIITRINNQDDAQNNYWRVYRFKNPYYDTSDYSHLEEPEPKLVFKCKDALNYDNKLSIVSRWESDKVVKVYIADGKHPIIVINLLQNWDEDAEAGTLDGYTAYTKVNLLQPQFLGLTAGSLKSGLVQYSYQLYNKYGTYSEIAPATKLIPIGKNQLDTDGKNISGYDQDTTTNTGVKIKIQLNDSDKFSNIYIYRITYVANNQNPTIECISDQTINGSTLSFIDSGQTAISTMTVEEYNSSTGIHIIPKVIESKNDYLFAANITTKASHIENFDDFDARSFSYSPAVDDQNVPPLTHLFNSSTGYIWNSYPSGDRTADMVNVSYGLTKDDIDYIISKKLDSFKKFDCYNKYNDLSKVYYDYTSQLTKDKLTTSIGGDQELTKEVFSSGEYDRFDVDGYYGGTGPNIDWRFIVTEIDADTMGAFSNDYYGNVGTRSNVSALGDSNHNITKLPVAYIKSDGTLDLSAGNVNNTTFDNFGTNRTYANPLIAYNFKSLRRDEVYRYGIVLYDEYGNASPVKWIADIRTPNIQWKGCESFVSHGFRENMSTLGTLSMIDLTVRPLGIRFNVKNLPEGCTGYEIVRCNRTVNDTATLSQGVVSRPVKRLCHPSINSYLPDVYTPTGFLTTGRFWAGDVPVARFVHKSQIEDTYIGAEADNYSNGDTFQFISPEIVYQKDSVFSELKNKQLFVNPIKYVFGSSSHIKDFYPEQDTLGANEEANDYTPLKRVHDVVNGMEDGWHLIKLHTIHPGLTNTNLTLAPTNPTTSMQYKKNSDSDYKTYYVNNAFIHINNQFVSDTDYVQSVSGASDAYNKHLSIMQFNRHVPEMFYSTLATYLYPAHNDAYVTNDDVKSMTEEVYSCSNPVTDTDWNSVSAKNMVARYKMASQDGSKVHSSNLWFDVAQRSYSYIKLYEQSDYVINRIHNGTDVSDNYYINSDMNIESTPGIEIPTLGKCEVSDINIASELGWDDFVTSSKDSNNIKYADSISDIGSSQFCNWICGGAYNYSNTEALKRDNPNVGQHTLWDNQETANITGPGGRCLLLKLKNQIPFLTKDNTELLEGLESSQYSNFSTKKTFTTSVLADSMCTRYSLTPDHYASDSPFMSNNGTYSLYDLKEKIGFTYTGPNATSDMSLDYDYAYMLDKDGTNNVNQYPIYRDSVLGTFICNLRHDVIPYGGSDYTSRKLNTYYSYGDYFTSTGNNDVFDGDTYILPMEYVSMHKTYNNYVNNTVTHSIIYSIPVETSINLTLTQGEEFSKNANVSGITNLQIEASNVNNKFTQDKPLYVYNTAYSSQPKHRVISAYNEDTEGQTTDDVIDYRCYYSNQKSNEEYQDSWLKFQSANYLDVDTRYGKITGLRTFHNSLVFWQEKATGLLSVNERVAISDDSNLPLMLGTGGVLSRYDYIATSNGMRSDQFVDTQSDTTLYWWDHNKREICGYSGGQESVVLSKVKGCQNILNKASDKGEISNTPSICYDRKYNELLTSVIDYNNSNKESGVLVYNEQQQVFTSLYTTDIKYSIAFGDVLYTGNDNNLYEWDRFDKNPKLFDVDIEPYVKYVVNTQPQIVKVYDNAEFSGNFDKDTLKNLKFTFNTVIGQDSECDGSQVTYREGAFRYATPRAFVNGNKVDYGNRLRGKTMQCEISSDSNIDFSLQYIINKYRISWN